MNHSSKFAPKAHEDFLLGYGSNSHTYRVYNSHFGKVMDTVNVRFDETNGSQKEHLPHVLDEPPLDEVIRSMAIGEIRPVETNARRNQVDDDIPLFPHLAWGAGNQNPEDNAGQDEEEPQNEENAAKIDEDEEVQILNVSQERAMVVAQEAGPSHFTDSPSQPPSAVLRVRA